MTREGDIQRMPDDAVRAVTADQPGSPHRFLLPIGVAQRGGHALGILREADKFGAPLDLQPQARDQCSPSTRSSVL